MRANGDSATQLTYGVKPLAIEKHPVWSPDGQWILYSHTKINSTDEEVYKMRANGSAQTNLTLNPARDSNARWSADGQHIVFETDRDGNQEIYSMRANGDATKPLSFSPKKDFSPVFGPRTAAPPPPVKTGIVGRYRFDSDPNKPGRVYSQFLGSGLEIRACGNKYCGYLYGLTSRQLQAGYHEGEQIYEFSRDARQPYANREQYTGWVMWRISGGTIRGRLQIFFSTDRWGKNIGTAEIVQRKRAENFLREIQ
jgi:dipeptidyl aminopeptidase/acylaminoacyl peptidase